MVYVNYQEAILKKAYLIDKTSYIQKLETIQNPVFLRPRRFGKSLFCSMLQYYYDRSYVDSFEEIFGESWIGTYPTSSHNQYIVLSLDFSVIHISDLVSDIEEEFEVYCNNCLKMLKLQYSDLLETLPDIHPDISPSTNLALMLQYLKATGIS